MKFDTSGNGTITRKALKEVLKWLMIPISSEEFKLLWKR